ncbi:MAG: metallophosphoesterase [Ideonella sp.]|nr:metallophosphoesterase [Ideonella sp.]
MTLILQVSDPHFGTEQAPVVEALVRLARAERPDLLVLSGDITQRATAAQFAAARAFVERLGVPQRVVIPGNHDIPLFHLPLRLFAPYRRWRRQFGSALEHVVETPDLLLIALKTTRRRRHVDGELSLVQIDRVAARLARAGPRQRRIVVTHHPLAVPRPQDRHDRVFRHAEAAAQWAASGADLVLGGHIHLPCLIGLHEQRADLARPLWVFLAGTAVSTRLRHEAGNSVNLLRWDDAAPQGADPGRTCRAERWDYRSETDAFAPVDVRSLVFDPAPAGRA